MFQCECLDSFLSLELFSSFPHVLTFILPCALHLCHLLPPIYDILPEVNSEPYLFLNSREKPWNHCGQRGDVDLPTIFKFSRRIIL